MAVQNMHGNNPKKWERIGTIVSTEDYDRYGIRLDGSRQLSIRNRKHLRQIPSSTPRRDIALEPHQPQPSREHTTPETTTLKKPIVELQNYPDPAEVTNTDPRVNADPNPGVQPAAMTDTHPEEPEQEQTEEPRQEVVQEPAPPRTPQTSERPRRSNAGKTRKYEDFVMCNGKLKSEAPASKRRLMDSPSPRGGGIAEHGISTSPIDKGRHHTSEMPRRNS